MTKDLSKSDERDVETQITEEDDEFEEFPQQDWHPKEGANAGEVCCWIYLHEVYDQHVISREKRYGFFMILKEMSVWEDNWDDEANENDFAKQLKLVFFDCSWDKAHTKNFSANVYVVCARALLQGRA